jgi:hypothetical protein
MFSCKSLTTVTKLLKIFIICLFILGYWGLTL